jgi:hypothetical protein
MLRCRPCPAHSRCLRLACHPHPSRQVIRESTARPASLTALMRDQYGNYVVQRCLEVASPEQRAALLRSIKVSFLVCAVVVLCLWGGEGGGGGGTSTCC